MSSVIVSGSRFPVRPSASDGPTSIVTRCPAARLFVNGTGRGDLDADHARGRRQRLHGDPDSADQPAAADRHDHGVERRKILEELERDRAGAGDHVRMRVRRDVESAAARRVRLRLPLRLVVVAALPQLGAGGADGVDLRARRVGGDEDRERKTERARGVRERPAVVARGCRHQPGRPTRSGALADAQRRVERAPDLVRAGGLDDFELQVNVGAADAGQPLRTAHRRPQHAAVNAPGRVTNVRQRDRGHYGAGFAAPACRMSARRPANAERGSTSSAPPSARRR